MIQMQAPYQPPQPPRSPETRPAPAGSSTHNSAANLSLACALLWPLCLFSWLLWNPVTHFAAQPQWIGTLTSFSLFLLPPVGIIAGLVGLVRSFTRPALRGSRWPAAVGLLLCCLWLAATLLL